MRKSVKVRVRFFADSYRKNPPFGESYRPHFVIKGASEYLGVQFANIHETPFGEEIISDVELLYDGVDYEKLAVGVAFEIREGAYVVGEGVVVSG